MARNLIVPISVYLALTTQVAANACLSAAAPRLQELRRQVLQIDREPDARGQSQIVPAGACTKRMSRIMKDGRAYSSWQNEIDKTERKSCLELEALKIEKDCECSVKSGIRVSGDERVLDDTLKASERMAKAQKRYRAKAIQNPAIRKLVDEASAVRDCFSLQTIALLNRTSDLLEREIGGEGPSSVPLGTSRSEGGAASTTVGSSRADGGPASTTVATSQANGGSGPTTAGTSQASGGSTGTSTRTSQAEGGSVPQGQSSSDSGLGDIVKGLIDIAGAGVQGYGAGRALSPPTRSYSPPPSYSGGNPRRRESDISGTR